MNPEMGLFKFNLGNSDGNQKEDTKELKASLATQSQTKTSEQNNYKHSLYNTEAQKLVTRILLAMKITW